jgi:hypothetical protein
VEHAEPVLETLDDVGIRGELVRHLLVDDVDGPAGREQRSSRAERPHRVAHVVERLEDHDQVVAA